MSEVNKAVTLAGFDPAAPTDNISISELPVPVPGPDEVLVRMTLRPVNPADIFCLMGGYPGFQPKEGITPVPGLEGTGVVAAVGANVTNFSVGQRVVGTPFSSVPHGSGTWQTYMVCAASNLFVVPDAVSEDAAAQALVNPVTVYGLLHEMAAPAGEYVLQTAAGSVLGRQLIQVCKARGIKTINVVRRAGQVEELKLIGADEVIVSTEEDVVERVKAITGGKGAWSAMDAVGGEMFSKCASSVRAGGTVFVYGALSGLECSFSIPDLLFRGVVAKGFWLVHWLEANAGTPEARERVFGDVMELLANGTITPYSGTRFPLDKAAEAVGASMAEARGGKVLLEG